MDAAERNPQAEQMSDESMVRNLAHQADAIWPQEVRLFDRYALDEREIRILDLGCGTGEITRRLAARYPHATIVGVDILEGSVELARRLTPAERRIEYRQADAFALPFDTATFDLVVCRHVSQSVPCFHLVIDEIARVLRAGGWLHLLSEDYGMLRMPLGARDPDTFWIGTVLRYLDSIRCDGRIGRHSFGLLQRAGFSDIAVDYVIVDTVRVPRATFAGILVAWRDGYTGVLAAASGRTEDDVRGEFDEIIRAIEDPEQYAVWHIPVISGCL
jgi:SAM-dependent methyltransferase